MVGHFEMEYIFKWGGGNKILPVSRVIKAHWVTSSMNYNFDNRDYSEDFSALKLSVRYW